MRGLAINVGANTNEPGFRAPIDAYGQFGFIPIPESEPVRADAHAPTYGELDDALDWPVDVADVRDVPTHLDPEFDGYPFCGGYTYGDEHGVKARPILELSAGDFLFFYATLSTGDERRRTGGRSSSGTSGWRGTRSPARPTARRPRRPGTRSPTTPTSSARRSTPRCSCRVTPGARSSTTWPSRSRRGRPASTPTGW
jgi:hypothetical protein